MTLLLTPKQLEAVKSQSPATMVIAGPGTGKTQILARRIEYLVQKQNYAPESILALTFTESGAKSMQERVVKFLGTDGHKININTFHGFAASLIDEHPNIFGYRSDLKSVADIDRAKIIRGILDDLDKNSKLKELRTYEDKYYYARNISSAISNIKREGFDPSDFTRMVSDWQKKFDAIPKEQKMSTHGTRKGKLKIEYEKESARISKNKELAVIYKMYQEKLKEYNYYDYEDMILRAISGLKESETLLHDLHEQYKTILVDEYQDTSGAQNKLLFLLINKDNPGIFIVGDDDQAVYRFQGATLQNFIDFAKHFPKANIVSLKENFRSPQFLLDAALHIANKNPERITKHLELPDKVLEAKGATKALENLHLLKFETDLDEYSFVVKKIKELKKKGADYGEMAIITRTNKEQDKFGDILRANGIPVWLSAHQDALKEPHIVSLMALARAAVNPHDDENMITFLLHPATPILAQDVWQILALRQRQDKIYQTLQKLLAQKTGKTKGLGKESFSNYNTVQETFDIINELSQSHTVRSGAHWLYDVMEKTGYLNWIMQQETAPYLISHTRAIMDEAKRFQQGNPDIKINDTLDHLKSHIELNIPLKPKLASLSHEAVRVMTAHNVKGQEYENVFIVHAVHGVWSGARGRGGIALPPEIPAQSQDTQDERRVFYVALTRAKKNAYMSWAQIYTGGITGYEDKEKEVLPTSFVTELEEKIKPQMQKKTVDTVHLSIKTTSTTTAVGEVQKNIVKGIVENPKFKLNATSLNSYLRCPQTFLYEKILRVPSVMTFSLTYGSAIHLALQKHFETAPDKRGLKNLLYWIDWYIDNQSTLPKHDNKRLRERAEDSLKKYYKEKLKDEFQPLYVEYYFGNTKFKNVRISGKIDKISLLNPHNETSKQIRVVDYKTNKKAKTLNAIMGRTQDENAPDYLRQLLFYKLLIENTPELDYEPREFSLDFVEPIKEIKVQLTDDAYKNFKSEIKKSWDDIQNLKFLQKKCGKCRYCEISL